MAVKPQFVVRSQPSTAGLNEAFRVHISPDSLEHLKLNTGDLCTITGENDEILGRAFAWRAKDGMGSNPKMRPAKMTETMRAAYNIDEGRYVNLSATTAKLVHADKVTLTDVTPKNYIVEGHENALEERRWRGRCLYALFTCEAFASGVTFDVHAKKPLRKRFYIENVKAATAQADGPQLYYCDDYTDIVIADPESSDDGFVTVEKIDDPLSAEYIGGLTEQLETLNRRMKDVLQQAKGSTGHTAGYANNRGILIHGFEGTGKSLILNRLEHTDFRKTLRLDDSALGDVTLGKKSSIIDEVFREAAANQPSLILMDAIDGIASPAEGKRARSIAAHLDRLAGSQVLVVATCRNLSDVHAELTRSGRISRHMELPIPDLDARRGILQVFSTKGCPLSEDVANVISLRTHGFTGNDLNMLMGVVVDLAKDRNREQCERSVKQIPSHVSLGKLTDGSMHSKETTLVHDDDSAAVAGGTALDLLIQDVEDALARVRPTALREIIFETPKTQWSDIAGSEGIKQRFDEVMAWSDDLQLSKYVDKAPEKGILLYGPPGCSKTLTARAVANSYNRNFIVIKGAELISMYVGESERAVREIFRKARAAKPCIIFFDEIDSIASERDSTKGLNVLTTLLNEMDGFESLEQVLVLAATNAPEKLDPAIMRPGRFNSKIYLGPPTAEARSEILSKKLGRFCGGDVDFLEIVHATEGYTGAEVVQICELAKEGMLRRRDRVVHMEDLRNGKQQVKRQVTEEMLRLYTAFAAIPK